MTSRTHPTTRRSRSNPVVALRGAVPVVVAAFVLVPLLATVLGGFKSLGELRVNPFGLPQSGSGGTTGDPGPRRATGS